MRNSLLHGVAVAVAVWMAGCFNPSFDNVSCGEQGECPAGLVCASDGLCQTFDAPSDGLIFHLPCEREPEDGVADGVGSGLVAECDEFECPDLEPGVIGAACEFDGNNEYLRVRHADVLDTSGGFTVAMWFLTFDLDEFLSMAAKPVGDGFDNSWQLELVPGGACGAFPRLSFTTPDEFLCQDDRLFTEQWYHAAAVWDGARKILYLDGVEVATELTTIEFDAGDVVFGADINSGELDEFWDGLIDDARIYGRALDADEIARLATAP